MVSSICGKLKDPLSADLCVLNPGHEGDHDYQAPMTDAEYDEWLRTKAANDITEPSK